MKNAKKVLSVLLSLMLVLGAVTVGIPFTVTADYHSGDSCPNCGTNILVVYGQNKYQHEYYCGRTPDCLHGWEPHYGGKATYKSGPICEGCGQEYGEKAHATLKICGETVDLENGGSYCNGKAVWNPSTDTLSLDGLELTYNSGNCIYATNLDFTIVGSARLTSTEYTVYVNLGNLDLEGDCLEFRNTADKYAIYVNGAMTVNGGSVYAATQSGRNSIYVNGTTTVNEGHIYAETGSGQNAFYVSGAMTVNGGSVYAKTGSSALKDSAIYTAGGITLNNDEYYSLGDEYAKEVIIKKPGTYIRGEKIEYGTYPQSKVTDETLLTSLNDLVPKDFNDWTSYGYYYGTGTWDDGQMNPGDFMRYYDAGFDGVKYRAVKFTAFRPTHTGIACSADRSNQDENGYNTDTVYWFRFEPIEWRVIDPEEGFIVCNSSIDSQAYNNFIMYADGKCWGDADKTYSASDYANSSIRAWLNDDFISTAFSATQQENIKVSELDNSCPYDEDYNSATTNDKIFLLSYTEVTNSAYGFSSTADETDSAKITVPTDYAKCQGVVDYEGSFWWLRSPYSGSGDACSVSSDGCAYCNGSVVYTSNGVVPALKLLNLKTDPTGAPLPVKYPLWVGGNQVTSKNMGALEKLDGITVADGGSVTFVPDDDDKGGTLYLNKATITGTKEYEYAGTFTANILVENTDFDLTISLAGKSTLNGNADKGVCLINRNSYLTITGEGKLDVTGAEAIIYCSGLTIENTTVKVTATEEYGIGICSGNTNITGSNVTVTSPSNGVYCHGYLNIDGSKLIATGGKYGIYFANDYSLTVSGTSAVTINGLSEYGAVFVGGFTFEDGNEIITPEEYTIDEVGVGKTVYNTDGSAATTVVIGQPCTVTFNNDDGTELQSGKILKGTAPEYKGETPVRTDESGQYTYTFAGWNPEITEITEDTVYTATFTNTVNEYTIKFANEDGTELQSDAVPYGTTPEYKGNTPTKEPTNEYRFIFAGWNPEISEVTGTATYTATYTQEPVEYKITWQADGERIKDETVPYGTPITEPADPEKDYYTFTGWDKTVPETMPAENLTFSALFVPVEYAASFVDESGKTVEEVPYTVETGSIEAPAVPEKTGYDGSWKEYTLTPGGITVKVVYTPVEYKAVFVDESGKTVKEVPYTVETESITPPDVPAKEGYEGKWEEYKLAAGGITVKPVYTEIPAEEPAEETPEEPAAPVAVEGNRSSNLGYKENQTFTADVTDIPEGAEIHWFVNGEDVGTGSEYTVVGPKEDYTIQAKVLDKDGNVLSEGAEQSITVKNSFLDKVMFFFAYLLKIVLTPVWYLEGVL